MGELEKHSCFFWMLHSCPVVFPLQLLPGKFHCLLENNWGGCCQGRGSSNPHRAEKARSVVHAWKTLAEVYFLLRCCFLQWEFGQRSTANELQKRANYPGKFGLQGSLVVI